MALGDQQLVEPRGRQPLLATGPSARLGQQPVHPVRHGLPGRPRPDDGLLPNGPKTIGQQSVVKVGHGLLTKTR
jgi:hypothetical protein